ncbi:outer membrane beta-barrel protein [Flaviaesturariibacter amylovorans]
MRRPVPFGRVTVLFLVLFLSFSAPAVQAQSVTMANGRLEVGAGIGPLFFLGDLGGNKGQGKRFVKDVNFPLVNMAKGVFAQYYIKEWLAVRVAANMGRVEGDDAQIREGKGDEQARRDRNLHFRSNIKEAYLAFEFSPTVFFERYDGLLGKVRPYGIAGVGVFNFNPQGRFYRPDGSFEWVDLKPLRTEGQGMKEYPNRKEYKLTQIEIPVGVGVKYYVNDNLFFGVEVMHRKTFTDYIDDVSTEYIDANLFANYLTPEQTAMANQVHFRQNFVPGAPQTRVAVVGEQRGNPKQTDAFFSTILRMGWRFNDIISGDRMAMRQARCPSFY